MKAHGLLAIGAMAFAMLAAGSGRAEDAAASSDAARAAYASAAALQNREAWDLAAEEWAALLAAHPGDPLAQKGRYYLGVCQLKNDQWTEAAKTFREVVAAGGDPATVALARWELGRGEFQAAQAQAKPEAYAAAAKTLAEFLEKSPGQPQAADATFYLGESLWQAGQRDQAVAAWQRFVRDHASSPRMPDVLYALGVGQAEIGNRKEAAATLKRFADAFPTHKLADDVALWRADIAIAAGAPAEAEPVLAKLAAGKGPRAAEALERLGNARWNQKNWAAAADAFGRLATDFPATPQAARAAVSAGTAYLEAKQPDKARPWLEKAVAAKGPQAGEAAHRLAVLELDAKQPARAVEIASQALAALAAEKSDAGPLAAKLELDRADALWELPDRRKEAAAAYAAIAERFPKEPAARTALSMTALALLGEGKADAALAKADLFLQKHATGPEAAKDPIVSDVRAIRAEALLAKGDTAAAAEAYRALIAGNPPGPRRAAWQVREATALVADRQWQKAHDLLAAATPALKDGAAAEAMLLDATALVELKKPADAAKLLAALDAAHPQWPRRDEALLLAVRAKREAGDRSGALATAEQLVAKFPAGPLADVAWYRLGQLRQDAGQFDAAIEAYATSRKLKPKGSRATWGLLAAGWCHEAKGRLPQAIATWTDLIDSYPDSSAVGSAVLARGDARQRTGDFKGGLADADRVLKPADGKTKTDATARGEARLLAALCLAGDKRYGEAAAAFRQLLAEQPDVPNAERVLFEMAVAESLDGRKADAEATFRKLVERFPGGQRAAGAWFEIGESKWAAAAWDDAAQAYRSAIKAAAAGGSDAAAILEQARHKLGWTQAMRKDHAAAAAAFAEQVAAHPAGPLAADGRAMLGESLFRTEKYAEASTALAAALADPARLSSDDLRGMAAVRASEAAAQQEKWDESLAFADRLVAAQPKSGYAAQARYAAAWARQNLGQLDKALEAYRELADASRTELAARARLMEGEVLFEQGKHRDAIKSFFKVAYGFGEKQAPAAYHPWQAQATFEAARCFEVLEKPDQARKLYAELLERYPDCQQATAAAKRLETLGPAPAKTPAAPTP
jgi:TolA-binding protein